MRWKDQDLPGRVSGVVETETGDLWVNGFSGIAHVSAAELKNWLRDPGYAVSAEHLDELDGLPGLSGEKLPAAIGGGSARRAIVVCDNQGHRVAGSSGSRKKSESRAAAGNNLRGNLQRKDLRRFDTISLFPLAPRIWRLTIPP